VSHRFASRGLQAVSRLVHFNRSVRKNSFISADGVVRKSHAASQWHASRSVLQHTKDVDLLILIGYNLSIRTGFEKRSKH
jgi:hypothetical protein